MALNFPAKIYQILENESAEIIRWHPNGAAFRIVDHGRFEREIIPKYFRHNQISSVQRQLNLYGFKCVSRGEDKGAFYHPKFKRGDWEIVKKITRYAPMKKPNEGSSPSLERKNEASSSVSVASSSDQVGVSAFNALANVASGTDSNFHHAYSQPSPFPAHFDRFGFPILPTDNYIAASSPNPSQWQWAMHHGMYHPPRYIHHMKHPPHPHPQTILEHDNSMQSNFLAAPSEQDNMSTNGGNSEVSSVAEEMPVTISAKQLPIKEEKNNTTSSSTSLAIAKATEDKNFISIKNSKVTVDPYFDLEDEFELFGSDNESSSTGNMSTTKDTAQETERSIGYGPVPSVKGPSFVDMGVNTEITQANFSIQHLDEYQIFGGVYMS